MPNKCVSSGVGVPVGWDHQGGGERYIFVCMYIIIMNHWRAGLCWCVCVLPCTQWDLLSGVSGEQEDQQGQARDEHAGDEQVEAVVEGSSPHHHGEGDVGVRLRTAVVEALVHLTWDLWQTKPKLSFETFTHGSNKALHSYGLPTRSHSPLAM